MKTLFHFLGTLLLIAVQALFFSGVLWVLQWLLSLVGIVSKPDAFKFIVGAVGIFALMFLYSTASVCITLYRYNKYPQFKDMNMRAGVTWDEYKEFIEGHGK